MSSYFSRSEAETFEIGRAIGARLKGPITILLYGNLGAGKTVLARGIASGLGIRDSSSVHSPSFTLVNHYPCDRGNLVHVDLYRLETTRDLYSIGIEELLAGESTVVIEWADKLPFDVPGALVIRIETDPETDERRIEVEGFGRQDSQD